MRYEAPARLHWVQVRDAVSAPYRWSTGRLTGLDGNVATVVVDGDEPRLLSFTCRRAEVLGETLGFGISHPWGGRRVLCTVLGRVLAVPLASRCEGDGTNIAIDERVVIVEERREFELLAEDASWSCRLFHATDAAAIEVERGVRPGDGSERPDRSTLFPRLRTTLLPERTGRH
jgi:hypothetical protein